MAPDGSQQLALTSAGLDFGPGGVGGGGGAMGMNFGGYHQIPVFFSPPGQCAAFLRFREPGLEFHHPWPGRWCALHDNVLLIFADSWSPTPMTSVPLEGTAVEPAGMVTGTMFTFVVGRARPLLEGPGMHFEEYFQAGSQYECDQWISTLRSCQRAATKARLEELEAAERTAGGAEGADAAKARRKETRDACRRKEDRATSMRKDRAGREETLRRLRAEHDATVGKQGGGEGAAAGVEALQRATLKARTRAKEAERRGAELATKARKAGDTLDEAQATLRRIEESVQAEIAAQQRPATPMLGAAGGGGSFGPGMMAGPGMVGGMMPGGMMGGPGMMAGGGFR